MAKPVHWDRLERSGYLSFSPSMKLRGKTADVEDLSSVARAAISGAPREEWLQCAVRVLSQLDGVDRLGVWTISPLGFSASEHLAGLLWDRDQGALAQGNLAKESRLSMAALPEELALRLEPVELVLHPRRSLFFGVLIGLHRALWLPLASTGRLFGALLIGSRDGGASLPRRQAESVAWELALALDCEAEREREQLLSAELAVARAAFQELSTGGDGDAVLRKLANVVEGEPAFCAIGYWNGSAAGRKMVFRWKSGDEAWLAALHAPAVESAWRRAGDSGSTAGAGLPNPPGGPPLSRVVAIPLSAEHLSGDRTVLGVMVAGFPGSAASLFNVERLELRAQLAAAALARYQARQYKKAETGKLRTRAETAAEPMLVLDRSGRVITASPSAAALLKKYAAHTDFRANSAGMSILEMLHAQDRQPFTDWLQAQTASSPQQNPPFIEAVLNCGEAVRIRATAVHTVSPEVAVFLEIQSAATEHAGRAEIELHNVLEWLEEGVLLFDAAERIRAMNLRFAQMAHLTPEQVSRCHSLDDLILQIAPQSSDAESFARQWRDLRQNADVAARAELQLIRPGPRLLERAARPVLNSAGQRLGRLEIYRDLTAERVFETKLLQTEKLASLGQTMTGIVHELSNPLTTILGYAQRLLLGGPASQSDGVRHILQEAERASRILRQVLANVREGGFELRSVNLNELVRHSLDMQRFALAQEKIKVELSLDPALPTVRGDAGRLQQVLLNLIGNSRQALEQEDRGGSVQIRTSQANGRVILEVQDDGPGIAEPIRARIFDPFFTTKPAGVGTGLGLTLVLSIVRAHGGTVHAGNVPQGGAHFRIELPPMATAEAQRPRPSLVAAPGRRTSQVHESAPVRAASQLADDRKRILVVEDEPVVARLIGDVLQDLGMETVVLFDGRAALERTVREDFDLIICDIKMPGGDGERFYKSLLRRGQAIQDKFLFVTGDVIGTKTRAFLEQYGLPHLAKPFRIDELTAKVSELFAEARPASRLATGHAITKWEKS